VKTQPLDFILSTLVLTALGILAFLATRYGFHPLTVAIAGPYYVVLDALLCLLSFGLLAALATRLMLVVKPLTPGRHSMNDPLFSWWKLFTVTYEFGRGALLPFTTVFFKPVVASLFGARLGSDIALGGQLVDPELISIGDEAIIGQGAVVSAHTITSGYLILAPVSIGRGATVGVNSVVMSGVDIGEGAVLTGGSVVPPDTAIPAFELWGGSPARKLKDLQPAASSAGVEPGMMPGT
jgi:carbonic anhydrase/acetyltransferase-like protein (isoleucine patch superfamily)